MAVDESISAAEAAIAPPSRSDLADGLTVIGVLALLLAAGGTLLAVVFSVDGWRASWAADRFTADVRALPDVRTVTVAPGLAHPLSTSVDLYADVRMRPGCSIADLHRLVDRLDTVIEEDQAFFRHPTVWCRDRGITVSPVVPVTRERLAVVDRLASDRTVAAGAVLVGQDGDERSPDRSNSRAAVVVRVDKGPVGRVAARWADHLRRELPRATVQVNDSAPDRPLAEALGYPFERDRSVEVVAGPAADPALLVLASALDEAPGVVGYTISERAGRIDIVAADTASIARLARIVATCAPAGVPVSVRTLL